MLFLVDAQFTPAECARDRTKLWKQQSVIGDMVFGADCYCRPGYRQNPAVAAAALTARDIELYRLRRHPLQNYLACSYDHTKDWRPEVFIGDMILGPECVCRPGYHFNLADYNLPCTRNQD
ncbi:unnamed protein product, partial [Mesorhabditis spiculigera]